MDKSFCLLTVANFTTTSEKQQTEPPPAQMRERQIDRDMHKQLYLEAKHGVCKYPAPCICNTAKHGQNAGRFLLLDTLPALSNREGHFACSLRSFLLSLHQQFSTLRLLNFHMLRSKITIQQLYSPQLKGKRRQRERERYSLCNAQEKLTPGLSPTSACNYRRGGAGGGREMESCLIRPRDSLKKETIPSPVGAGELFF